MAMRVEMPLLILPSSMFFTGLLPAEKQSNPHLAGSFDQESQPPCNMHERDLSYH